MKRLLLFFCFAITAADQEIARYGDWLSYDPLSSFDKQLLFRLSEEELNIFHKHLCYLYSKKSDRNILVHDFKEAYIEGISFHLRCISLLMTGGRHSYSKEYYMEFVRPYLDKIFTVLTPFVYDIHNRDRYTNIISFILESLVLNYPDAIEMRYKNMLLSFESGLAAVLSKNSFEADSSKAKEDANRIAVVLDELTRQYYKSPFLQEFLIKLLVKKEEECDSEIHPMGADQLLLYAERYIPLFR